MCMFDELLKEIEKAKKEWELALARFEEASEAEAVDFNIYYILAAERRYMYLLKKYKNLLNGKNKKKIIKKASVERIQTQEGDE